MTKIPRTHIVKISKPYHIALGVLAARLDKPMGELAEQLFMKSPGFQNVFEEESKK